MLTRIWCLREHGWCSATKCMDVAPCPRTEKPFNGKACPRCGCTKLDAEVGVESLWVACTTCNWSVTTFFTKKRRDVPSPKRKKK